jgi:linoleoyl-CoA desaturase
LSAAKISFQPSTTDRFYTELKSKVNSYFSERRLSPHANFQMVLKTVLLFSLTFASYGLIIADFLPLWAMFLLCIVMGVGIAGLGFSVAHDSIHGAYSSNPKVNYLLGLTMNIIGGNRYVWSITHNVVHHTYTNIHEYDEDLELAPFIRLSKHKEHKAIHRYQHVLAFIAYSFATFFWVFFKDYKKVFQKDIGPYKNKKHPVSEMIMLFLFKAVYYSYTILIPWFVMSITWWQFLIGFFTVHVVAGIILGIIFQLAHTVEGTDHVKNDGEGVIEDSWAIHQMRTTSNFAMNNKIINWYVGGLNFQVEHHLFPRVCSIHYPAISKILQTTAAQYNVPYHYHENFSDAVRSHYRYLKHLGSNS